MTVSTESGVPIYNETHRQRFNFAAHVCADYVKKRPELKQTADYSHFCCVAFTLLDDQQAALDIILPTIEHIHARVGHTESPQVSAPDAPEYADALNAHTHWWLEILRRAAAERREHFTITCEFGPSPYMPTVPFTQQAINNQWKLNVWMKDYIKRQCASFSA
ncbi:hypothetical protein [Alteromonas oceanisediminis]|uniref:hypothetical protein n=1 Tax=Alteromonas oceanisediminis TaxID=2836180 RepID=UPI001BD98744|nr:hypothetical protein [Alteromonas oceanisediminis]MBT0585566.1 hypothetical protein [Alteromonas oceanisediminis]